MDEPIPAIELARSVSIPAETLASMTGEHICRALGRGDLIDFPCVDVEVSEGLETV